LWRELPSTRLAPPPPLPIIPFIQDRRARIIRARNPEWECPFEGEVSDMSRRTHLIAIGGSPGSGKTTLARELGVRLRFPVIARDAIKEVLLDTLPPANREESMRLGGVSWPMMYAVLDSMIDRVPDVMLESNFRRGRSEAELLPRVDRCESLLVQCDASWEAIESRIREREYDRNRHPGHFDQVALPAVRESFDRGEFAPMELGIPVVTVSTTDGYEPALDDLVGIIERRWTSGE
jgi:predicted kinase